MDAHSRIREKPQHPDPAPTPTPTPEATVANGIYSMDVTSSSSMFKVVDCILTAKDGKMSAVLTLSGTGYGYLYMGTKEEAQAQISHPGFHIR